MENNEFIRVAVSKGLAELVTLRLAGTPSEDMIIMTASTWCKVLDNCKPSNGWIETEDLWRIEKAFTKLLVECERWPAPRLLLDRLPSRKSVEAVEFKEVSDEQKEKNVKNIRKILKGLVSR